MSDPLMVAAQADMLDAETRAKELEHSRMKDAVDLALKAQKQSLDEKKEANRSGEKQKEFGMGMVKDSLKNMIETEKIRSNNKKNRD
jgi:hypothetical protein